MITDLRTNEDRFLGDFQSLFRRHRVRTGTPSCLDSITPLLAPGSGLQSDLFTLCTAISHMFESDLTGEELLRLVARAAGGPKVLKENGDVTIPASLHRAFVAGYDAWTARLESFDAFPELEADPNPRQRLPPQRGDWFADAAELAGQDQERTGAPATATRRAARRASITPETPIGELTISELRTYLDEIEQRVDRLQPYLSSLRSLPSDLSLPIPERADLSSSPPRPADAEPREGTGAAAAAETVSPSEQEEGSISRSEAASESGNGEAPAVPHSEALRLPESAPQQHERTLFKTMSQPHKGRSHLLLEVAAAVVVIASASYLGYEYLLHTPPAISSPVPSPAVTDPRATSSSTSPAIEADRPVLATQPPGTAPARRPAGTTAPRPEPRAIRMEAQAARAESQPGGEPNTAEGAKPAPIVRASPPPQDSDLPQ